MSDTTLKRKRHTIWKRLGVALLIWIPTSLAASLVIDKIYGSDMGIYWVFLAGALVGMFYQTVLDIIFPLET